MGKGGRCVRLTTFPPSCAVVMKSGSLNFLETSGPLQACNGTDLPLCKNDVTCSERCRGIAREYYGSTSCDVQLANYICSDRLPATHELTSGHSRTDFRPLTNRLQTTHEQTSGHSRTDFRSLTNRLPANHEQTSGKSRTDFLPLTNRLPANLEQTSGHSRTDFRPLTNRLPATLERLVTLI